MGAQHIEKLANTTRVERLCLGAEFAFKEAGVNEYRVFHKGPLPATLSVRRFGISARRRPNLIDRSKADDRRVPSPATDAALEAALEAELHRPDSGHARGSRPVVAIPGAVCRYIWPGQRCSRLARNIEVEAVVSVERTAIRELNWRLRAEH